MMGKVLILEEKIVTDPLEDVRLKSYRARRSEAVASSSTGLEDAAVWRRKRRRRHYHEASLTSVPTFVYEMYDSVSYIICVAMIRSLTTSMILLLDQQSVNLGNIVSTFW